MPLTIFGPAVMCAVALVMCLSSLTVLSSALRVGDPLYTQSRLLGAHLLLRGETTASIENSLGRSQHAIQTIGLDISTLPPMAFTQFCLRYANECKPQPVLFRGGRLKLTDRRRAELVHVNGRVNSSILPERNEAGLAGEKWLLGPAFGDCNDYAVTKRHQLIARGWPARAVLLSEVVTVSGEHHLVAVVRTDDGDLVLDNLTDRIVPWFQTPYQWLRIQTPKNPIYWASISGQSAGRIFVEAQAPQRFAVASRPGV